MYKRLRKYGILVATCGLLAAMGTGCAGQSGAGESSTGSMGKAGGGDEIQTVRYAAPGNDFADQDYVLEQVNQKLLEDGMNLRIELIRIPWDAWDQKINLMLSTGEEFDLMHVMEDKKGIAAYKAQGAIVPITEYVDKYPDLKEKLEYWWPDFTLGGEIYAVPCGNTHDYGKDYGKIYYQEEWMEKAGCKPPTTIEGVIETAEKIQKVMMDETGQRCYMWDPWNYSTPRWLHRTYDVPYFTIDETISGIARVDLDGSVCSWYEHPDFKKDCEIYRELYTKGLIHPDILTLDHEYTTGEGNSGRWIFGLSTFTYRSNEIQVRQSMGTQINDFIIMPERGRYKYTTNWNGNAIPTSCKHPEASVKFLDWLYKNDENYRLFMYGIEGRDYNVLDDGRAEFIKGPDGNYKYLYDEWQIGLVDLRLFEEGRSEKSIVIDKEPLAGDDVVVNAATGFKFNPEPVMNELSNVEAEVVTSIYPIKLGILDYDSNIDAAIANLKAAGLDKVIAEYDRQVQEFLATDAQYN